VNYRTILIVLFVLGLLIVPGANALASPSPSSQWGDCVAVLPGQNDDIGGVLSSMNIPYRSITAAQVKDDAFLDKLCILFIASGSAPGREAGPHIARWVEQGGQLYVSGSAIEVILDAFPGRLAFGVKTQPGFLRVELTDPGAAMAIDKQVMLQVPTDGWTLIGKTNAYIHARGFQESGEGAVVVSFDVGQGWVVYNVLTAGADTPDRRQKLISFFVIRTLLARPARDVLRRFPPSYAPPIHIADVVDPGKFSTEYVYTMRGADDWDVAAVWNGGRLGVTLRRPDNELITQYNDTMPLVVPIRDAMPGEWKVFVRGLDVPSASSPFVLILIPRRGTNLLNAAPTPLQFSMNTQVLAVNLGVALMITLLLLLGAALFADTLTGLQGRSSPALSAMGNTVGRFGRAVGSVFMPTTWDKLPPLARRLGAVLELTVFLALTALVASFLDPHFTPTSVRGVSIFIGMLVALTINTLVYVLVQSLLARPCGVIGAFQIRPLYLLVAVACVLVSRLLEFTPGYLFGLPAGFAALGAVEGAKRRDGLLAFVALLGPLLVGLLFWALTIPTDSALQNIAQSQVDAMVSGGLLAIVGIVQSAFLLIFVVALWQTFFELFPIAGLKGWTLFTRARLVWFVFLVAAAFLAVHTLINPNATLFELVRNYALLLIVVVLAIYSAAAVGTWLLFNADRLRGEGKKLPRGTLLALILTVLIWLCVLGGGAALVVIRYIIPR